MVRNGTAFLLVFGACAFSPLLSAQVGTQYPGQYPPGSTYPGSTYPGSTYPGGQTGGISLPGRRKNSNGNNSTTTNSNPDQNAPTQSFVGSLRRMAKAEMVLETDDHRVLTVGTGTNTRFFDDTGKTAAANLFAPGDHVSVDASQDDQGYLHGVRVRLERAGSAADRAAASETVDESPLAKGGVSNDGDSDRPRLRRADSKATDANTSETKTSNTKTSDAKTPETAASTNQKSGDDEYVVPVDRKAPATTSAAPLKADPDDPGPPTLRRGKPTTARPLPNPVQVADNRPPVSPHTTDGDSETNPSIRRANTGGGDPIIEKAREVAFEFTDTLPNYTVKQLTTRYYADNVHGKDISWQPHDTVSADVVYENGKEDYRNIQINGKAPKEKIENTGTWSTGEFATVLQDIFAPSTSTTFFNKRASTIVNRSATRYDFTVEQPNSHWHVYAASQSYRPGYSGTVWIDKETSRVLRIEKSARSLPSDFPFDTVESAIDYDSVLLTNAKFLLPVHSEALSCSRGGGQCSRNVIDFRNYKKFGADTSISFDVPETDSKKTPSKKKP